MLYIKQIILTAIFLYFSLSDVQSQDIRSNKFKQNGMFFGAGIGESKNQIINTGADYTSDNKYSLNGFFEAGYFFTKYFGLISGVSYSSYKTQFEIASYQNQFKAIDIENEYYEMRVSGSDITETQQINIVSIPVYMTFRYPLNKSTGIYLQTGLSFTFPLDNSYESTGTFTYKGYFPSYNVILENLPEYGFATNQYIESDGNLELKTVSTSFVAAAGIDYLISKRVQISGAAFFDRSLSSISDNALYNEFQLSTGSEQLNTIMGGSSKTLLQSIGMKIGIRYYLSDYTKFKYHSRPSRNRNLREYRRLYKGYGR